MRNPPITITCDCGETNHVLYGERWQCEICGRTWDTRQIPAEDYELIIGQMRRLRLEALGAALAIAAVLVPLIVFVGPTFVFVVPVVAAGWLFVYVPRWRRKARRAAQSTPRWELHPE